jgi:hypothetical protein
MPVELRCLVASMALAGALCACNPRPQAREPDPPPARTPPAPVLSSQQIEERSAKCAKDSRVRFSNDANQGIADAQGTVAFAQHYNIKLDTCFMVLTAISPENPGGEFGPSPAVVVRKLIGVDYDELYGEYLGGPPDAPPPDRPPDACQVLNGYCASGREWEVMIRAYMQG